MKGTAKQARTYCQKTDTRITYDAYVEYCLKIGIEPKGTQGPYEYGDLPAGQGRRSDLHNFTDEMKEGKSLAEVALDNPTTFVKYHSGFQKLAFYMNQNAAADWRDVHVEVFYGATGVGKTRYAIELAKEGDEGRGWFLMRKDDGKTMWWDGYTGQTTIILDEFHGNWCTYKGLLGILDGHPYRVPIKGGHEWARWTTVYITASRDYKGWYARDEYSELERRINVRSHLDPLAASMPKTRPEARSGGNNSPTSSGSIAETLIALGSYTPEDVDELNIYGNELLRCDEEMFDDWDADMEELFQIPQTSTNTF